MNEKPLFQSCLLEDDIKFKELPEKVRLIYDSKAGRLFHFLAYYPYMIITLGQERTLQITWKLKRTFYIFLQALCYWDFSSGTFGVGREFGKGAQKCRGG